MSKHTYMFNYFFLFFLYTVKKLKLNSNKLFEALKYIKYAQILPCEKLFEDLEMFFIALQNETGF